MAKRGASSELNHDNWDREDEPEDAGTFKKASEDTIKKRVIKVARRRNLGGSEASEEEKPSVFGGFSGFSKAAAPAASTFGFLTSLNTAEPAKTNGISEKGKTPDKNQDEYYGKLKGLNESVASWIQKHVTTNPFISLQPIFKDYDKYFAELESNKTKNSETSEKKIEPFSFASTLTAKTNSGSFGSAPNASSGFGSVASATSKSYTASNPPQFGFAGSVPSSVTTSNTFSFSSTMTTPGTTSNATGFSFGNTTTTSFSSQLKSPLGASPSASSFSFGNPTPASGSTFAIQGTVAKPSEDKPKENDEDNEEDPSEVEFKPMVEEGHIYTIRCKAFVKKDKSYAVLGVGNLFLKPVPDSEKVQLIVRADTSLGSLLCNFILSEGIPMQRMGKNDVMLVCLPTPDTKPPPVPILFRVKTSEDADELLKTLQKHKK